MEAKKIGWLPILASMAITAAGPAWGEPPIAQSFDTRVVNTLGKTGFLRNATCAQFSSVVLEQSGLPSIGQVAPVTGTRGDVDRRLERQEPPIFQDTVTRPGQPRYVIRVKANGMSGVIVRQAPHGAVAAQNIERQAPHGAVAAQYKDRWVLEVRRASDFEGREFAVLTQFEFRVGAADNRSSCELQRLRIQARWPERGKERVFDQTLGAHECLDLFDPEDEEALPQGGRQILWVEAIRKRDCAVGLRYFEEVKEAYSKSGLH